MKSLAFTSMETAQAVVTQMVAQCIPFSFKFYSTDPRTFMPMYRFSVDEENFVRAERIYIEVLGKQR